MATKRYTPAPLVPRYIGGIVIVRIPEGTAEHIKAKAVALAKQLAYDYSEHPTFWSRRNYRKNT